MRALDSCLTTSDLEKTLAAELAALCPAGDEHTQEGRRHIDNLTKPLGSLGQLEEMALALYRIGGGARPLNIEPGLMYTVAADHGVAAEGVSVSGQEVTRQMLMNFLAGGAGINALCRSAGMDFMAVDVGVAGDEFAPHPGLIRARVTPGTRNMAEGPAMTREECLRALLVGMELASQAVTKGYRCLAAGEMGIANTTPSSALYCAWLGLEPEKAVGAGSGISGSQIQHKIEVVRRALRANHQAATGADPLETLAALGGLEIAAMAGIMLGAAKARVPMLVDGFIAGASYTAAWKLAPAVHDYCFFAHCSAENAHQEILRRLGKKPMLDLWLRLGEGSGAALGYPILRAATSMFNNMASFESAGVTR